MRKARVDDPALEIPQPGGSPRRRSRRARSSRRRAARPRPRPRAPARAARAAASARRSRRDRRAGSRAGRRASRARARRGGRGSGARARPARSRRRRSARRPRRRRRARSRSRRSPAADRAGAAIPRAAASRPSRRLGRARATARSASMPWRRGSRPESTQPMRPVAVGDHDVLPGHAGAADGRGGLVEIARALEREQRHVGRTVAMRGPGERELMSRAVVADHRAPDRAPHDERLGLAARDFERLGVHLERARPVGGQVGARLARSRLERGRGPGSRRSCW